jgi:hypothetical protein
VTIVLLCDVAFLNPEGQPCILGMFDRIGGPDLPLRKDAMMLFIRHSGRAGETVALRAEGLTPQGDVIWATEGAFALNDLGVGSAAIELIDLAFAQVGDYIFRVALDGRECGWATLRVEQRAGTSEAEAVH